MSDEGILNKTPKTKHSKQTVTLFDIYEIQVITLQGKGNNLCKVSPKPKCEIWSSPTPDSPGSRVVPLHPFTSAISGEDLRMAVPWIYTRDLTIIHSAHSTPPAFLKVNCRR